MQKSMRRMFYVLIAFVISCPPAFAGVPDLIDFQGSLVDNDGVPVTGTPTIQFALYSANTGGAAIWSETKVVVLQDGVYSTQLGDLTALTDDIWENAQLWLGIKVDADDEMTPRVRIVAVPYAIRAKTAEVAEVAEEVAGGGGMVLFGDMKPQGNTTYGSITHPDVYGLTDLSRYKTFIPRNGEIRNFFVWEKDELPADSNVTFTIRVNGADTPLAVTHLLAQRPRSRREHDRPGHG